MESLSQQVENDHFLPWNALNCVVGWGSASNSDGRLQRSPNPLAVEGRGRRFCVMSPGAHEPSYASVGPHQAINLLRAFVIFETEITWTPPPYIWLNFMF